MPNLPFDLRDVSLPLRFDGYAVLTILAVATLAALVWSLADFRHLGFRWWLALLVLLALSVALNAVLLVPALAVLPAGVAPRLELLPPVPLLGLVAALLAGLWLGIGPALLVGAAGGAARWLVADGRFTQPFEMALLAAVAAFFMQQAYRGWAARALRHPLGASLAAGLLMLVALPFTVLVVSPGSSLAAIDYALSWLAAAAVLLLGECMLSGLLVEFANLAFPSLRRSRPATETPPYARSLNRRLLFTILPITFLTISAQVVFVALTAVNAAHQQTAAQLSRNAQATAELLDAFFRDGQAILDRFSGDERLQGTESAAQQTALDSVRRTVAFFDEILLAGSNGSVLASTTAIAGESGGPPALTPEEILLLDRAIRDNAPQRTGVHSAQGQPATISFIQPFDSAAQGRVALIGRTRLAANPRIGPIRQSLSESQDLGLGYLVDENGQIVVHPDPTQEMRQWVFDRNQPPLITSDAGGTAYIDLYSDNTRRFIFVQPVEGLPWRVAFELPYRNILGAAAAISVPLVILFGVIMVGAILILPLIGRRVSQPLGTLARATGQIAAGEMDQPLSDMGEDEVGRLGASFEQMRQSLQARMEELSLLLNVSQAMAAALDLERGIPPILDAAMRATSRQADAAPPRVARLIALDDEGRPARVITRGDGPTSITALDEALTDVTLRNESPLPIENVARSHGALDPEVVGPGLKAMMALPLRHSGRALGIMWLGFAAPRGFDESEVDLLITLSAQAAVFLENVGLFEAAEGGRRRLQAVLSSTTDAVVVTGRDHRIVLCNPAAEIAFGLAPGAAVGRAAEDVIADGLVVDLLTESGDASARTAEIMLPDGRTLYGSASSIVGGDGARIGRVAVMRDITHFKELDSLKTEFVNTVSHDLRSPLTYMRGYVTMVPMVGPVTGKQEEYLDKIAGGIAQMTDLIDDLLDLGRIEAGIGIVTETVVLSDVAQEAMESMQSHALSRKTTLEFDPHSARASVQGDRQLIKHAVANLVDNAIKYTPAGGRVQVGVDERDGYLVVRVTDNGIGIAPTDQPRLFEKFYRVKRRDTLEIKGTGLGLAIVKSIAEWHHGQVWVDSQLGQGATFYISLPTGGE